MKYLLFIFLLVAALTSAGCTDAEHGVTTPTPQIVYVTVLVTPTSTQIIKTAAPTQAPILYTTKQTTILPSAAGCPTFVGSMPIPSPIALSGVGDGMVFFETVAPGKVKFNVATYSPSPKDDSCTDSQISFQLAGTSGCNSIESMQRNGRFYGTTTPATIPIDLPNGGKYSITTKGCYRWQIIITNG
jgi:hypothetical protein